MTLKEHLIIIKMFARMLPLALLFVWCLCSFHCSNVTDSMPSLISGSDFRDDFAVDSRQLLPTQIHAGP